MSAGIGKQAKTLNKKQIEEVLETLKTSEHFRHPERETVAFLLSVRQGLRACEIAKLTWSMVTRPDGTLDDAIHLRNRATKKMVGGRIIPLHVQTLMALAALQLKVIGRPEDPVIQSERMKNKFMTPHSIVILFDRLYEYMGFEGCSSHSGRRTFATRAVRAIGAAGGTIRDVQKLLGHKSLETTAVYIENDSAAQRAVMELI